MTFRHSMTVAIALVVASTAPLFAQSPFPPPGTKTGTLNCALSPSIGLIVGGLQQMTCRFTPNGPNLPEAYVGSIGTVGLDLGFTAGGALAWDVFAPTNYMVPGSLAGAYVGASGNVGVGVGVGANFLVGGSGNTVALQPLSIEGTVGVNLSVGVSNLQLRPAM